MLRGGYALVAPPDLEPQVAAGQRRLDERQGANPEREENKELSEKYPP